MATTSNYGWTIPDDTDLVKNGALAIRTLGNAIDTTAAASFGGGLVHINTTSFSAVTGVNIDNVFSATYTNYFLVIDLLTSATADFTGRLRVSGADNTTSNYDSRVQALATTFINATNAQAQTSWTVVGSGQNIRRTGFIYGPFASVDTFMRLDGAGGGGTSAIGGYAFDASTSFDGISFYVSGGATMTGYISIFGVKE